MSSGRSANVTRLAGVSCTSTCRARATSSSPSGVPGSGIPEGVRGAAAEDEAAEGSAAAAAAEVAAVEEAWAAAAAAAAEKAA
ncbi:hypothetical protein DIPPA_03908 [Diplonema papillatum]|nr:hypothetical protein DIPPA_03908 [Diplonema papillatum]